MASIIIDKKKSGDYIRIVQSYRDEDGKAKMRTLFSLGRVDGYSSDSLKKIGQRLYQLGGGEIKEVLEDSFSELGRYNYGYYLVYSKIFSVYGLDKVLDRIVKKKKLSYDLTRVVLLMLVERLHDPCSKRGNFLHQEDYLGIGKVCLQHLYRSLNHLSDASGMIQQNIYMSGRDLFNQKLDVVFYDVTTFYFDSELEREGSIRQKGFGKDGKIGNTQVVFAMLIDEYKQPIGYKLYSGDTWEGHTYPQMVASLKKEYQIDKVVLVADRGMLNKDNLAATTSQGYEFVMGEKLKMLPAKVQATLLDLKHYNNEWISSGATAHKLRYMLTEYKGRKIIATYSERRAAKDRKEREKKLLKAEHLLKNPSEIKRKAKKFFLKNVTDDRYTIDEQKIKKSEKYDGFLAICSNSTTLTVAQMLDQYHHLFQIEHSFRTFKSYLETRPMFHWTDKRIKGHICLCYMAYTLLNKLMLDLERKGTKMSENQIRDTLDKMQVSLVEQNDQQFYLRAKHTKNTDNILKTISKKPLPDMMPTQQLHKYLA